MTGQSAFREQLRKVKSGDAKEIENFAYGIGTIVLEQGAFPAECFSALLELLKDECFLSLSGSWRVLSIFEENWDELSQDQRTELLPILETGYERFRDWMACFVITGILGELYRDERAFATLCRLKNCREEKPRSLVPHRFEHIARDAADRSLAERAFSELATMRKDESNLVRAEVDSSLAKLKKSKMLF